MIRSTGWLRIATLLCVLVSMQGCSTSLNQIKDARLRVDIDHLERVEKGLRLVLLVHNPNDHPVLVESLSLSLALDGLEPVAGDTVVNLDIASRGRERMVIDLGTTPAIDRRMDRAMSSERSRLPYVLEGRMVVRERRDTRVHVEGVLYPVPGYPGRRFR